MTCFINNALLYGNGIRDDILQDTPLTTLGFYGAAGTVTGSKYLLKTNKESILIDCGMFQGRKELRQRNWQGLKFDPKTIQAVIITHAHIDHLGYLPRLAGLGFRGKVYASAPTTDLAGISLLDAAHLQEEDAEYRNKKKLTHHEKALPLFTTDDAQEALSCFSPVPFGQWTTVSDSIRFRMHLAGHILGAASVEVELKDGNRKISILFSGDIGRYGNPLTVNPEEPPTCDYLVCESTYGGRMHPAEDPYYDFTQIIRKVQQSRGILLIPAFAVSRTQQISYLVSELIEHQRIKPIEIHIDSPMAISATDIYCKYHSYHSVDLKRLGGPDCVISGRHVHLHRKRKSSKMLNKLKGPAIIMSASGMLTGGRIMHHLINRLPDKKTVLALVGFMAEGTLGRRLMDGDRTIYIHKQPVEVRAEVISLHGLSGHADYYELLHWLEPIKRPPKKVFITHGELSQSEAMAGHIREQYGWECTIPGLDDITTL